MQGTRCQIFHDTDFVFVMSSFPGSDMSVRLQACCLRLETWLYGSYAWLLFILTFLTAGSLIGVLQLPRAGRRIAHAASRMMYFLGGVSLVAEGLDRLPDRQHILLVNHSSFVDGIALSALLPPTPGYSFVVRQEYDSQVLFYPLLKGLNTLILERHASHGDAHLNRDKLIAALQEGRQLLIFPEGAFRPEPGLLPFHSGAFIASARVGVPITLAVLRGAREELRPGTWLPHRTSLHLTIGPTLLPDTSNVNSPQILQQQAYQLMQEIMQEMQKDRQES